MIVTRASLLLLTAVTCACSSAEEVEPHVTSRPDAGVVSVPPVRGTTAPARYVRGECGISLQGEGLTEHGGDAGDTCIAEFEDLRCTYRIQYGQGVRDPLSDASVIERDQVEIDEGSARITTVRDRLNSDAFLVALYVASFPQDGPDYALSATARCELNEALAAARAVLETIDIPHVGEGLCAPIAPNKCSIQ